MNRPDSSVSTGHRPTLRDRLKEGTRTELRGAALTLFARDGYAATSVDDIARAAGVSRSTFFRYFGTKEALLLGSAEENSALYLEILAGRPSGEDRLEAIEESFIEFTERLRPDERREETVLETEVIRSDPSLRAGQAAIGVRFRDELAQALANRGGRSEPDIEDVLASAILSQLAELVGERWTSPDDTTPVRDLIRGQFASLRNLVNRTSS